MVVSNNPIRNITGDLDVSGLQLNNRRQKLRQRFDILRKLGQGTYGKVQLALNKETGEEVAIKTIKKAKIETEQDLIRIQREIQIMSSMQHPHIIHIYEVFENKEKIVLVMEYACGGELYDFLNVKKTLSESEARRIFRQISSAVYYCHKNKICHRDLKLENILLDENGNAKIADFGLSNIFNEQRLLNTFCGSPLYASPEIVKGTPYYGPEVDCWSLGVLLYTLVYGAMPFDGSNFRRLVKQISEGDYYEPKKPSEASMLIRHLLTVAPAKRATIEDVCEDWWINLSYDDSLLAVAEELGKIPLMQLDFVHQSRSTDTVNEQPINTKENNKKEEKSLTNSTAESNLSIQSEPNNTEALTDSLTSQPELSYTVETESDENKQQKQSQDTVTIKEISDENLSQSFSEVKKDDVIENQDSIQEVTKPIEIEQEFVEHDPNIEENLKNVPILENNEDISQEMNESCSTMISEDLTSHSENGVAKSPEICSEIKSEKSEKLSNESLVSTKLKSSSDNIEDTNLESKPKPKARSASLKTTTLNTNIKEKKSFVYPGLRVSEAKLAFENKQVDKKIKATPGLKVSSARKAFEVTSNESLTTRRASMPAKLKVLEPEDKTAIKTKPLSKIEATETKQKDVVKPQKKIAGFLPTLDVTVAVKPRKDLGKPPPFPRTDTSTTSGTSSGENTPDITVNPPFKTSSAKSRRSSCPKSTSTSNSDKNQATEPRQRSKSDADTEANNPVIISGESSLKSSSSTLTGNDTDKNEIDEIKDDSRKEIIKNSNDSTDLPEKVSKISCMEIQLSNNSSQQQVQEIKTTMAEPQFILRQPPGGGKFTLLGVTSEVSFDVAAAPEVEIPTVEIKTSPRKQSSNLFMSVTLPPPPPPSDYGSDTDDVISETSNTKTLKTEDTKRKSQVRKSTEKQQKMADYNNSLKRNRANQTPSERYYRDISKNPETLHGRQGYNVYRSKFCSLQKAFLNEPNRWPRDRSVERSESFSSTGSIDDMEDVYECFTPNSSQYSTDDVPTISRQLSYSKKITDTERRSKMDVPRRYEDTASPMSSGFGSSRLMRPQIYDRSCSNSRSSWSSAHFRNSPSSNSVRDYGSDADTILSDSSSKNQWGYRKCSQEDDNNDDLVTKSLYHYKNRSSSLSRSVSEDESASVNEDQSPTSSLSSKYIGGSKRTSLSSRFRSEKCKDEVNPMTSSLHNQETVNKLPLYPYSSTYTRRTRTSNDDMLNNTTDFGANQSSNYRYESASKNNPVTQKDSFDYSIYGTTRRTRSCNKSATQELSSSESKKSDAPEESVQRRRPRSLILSDTDWSPTKQGQIDNKRDSSSSSSTSQYRFNRSSNSCDRLEESSDIKKKLDREFESQYASQTTQRNLRSFWRAGSHGREIGTGLNKRKSLDDTNRPSLLRRASLSEDPRGRFGSESGKSNNNNLPNGAAEYWAKRYGTNGRVHPTKEESSEDKNKARKGTDMPSPVRRRSSAGIEAGNDDERTRGLLQYARTISHELNQLHSDLTATFKKRKDKEKEIESETEGKIENKSEGKDAIKNEVGNVVEELKRLENDLISLGAAPKKEIKREVLNNEDNKPVIVNKQIEKVERKISLEEFECGSSGTATPTDQDDTCSLCSDYENRSGTSSGLEESVSERIRRKSYFARFQDKRSKNRATNKNNSETKTHCRHCRNKVASESNVETDKSDKLDTEKQLSNNYSRHSMPRDIRYNNNTEENGGEGEDEKSELNSSDVKNKRKISKDGSNESINSQVSDSHSGRASSVVPELLQPSTYSKSFYRHHSTSDFLRPISPISRRLSMLDNNTTSSSTNGYMGSGWSTYERRKSRPSASIFSSLPLEATVQSRANLRSRHDYLINRALSSLDDRNPRPLTPNSRRMSSYHDNYMTDMRRFSAILDNSSPRDVIRKALDIL